jgi:hypothetical protein
VSSSSADFKPNSQTILMHVDTRDLLQGRFSISKWASILHPRHKAGISFETREQAASLFNRL